MSSNFDSGLVLQYVTVHVGPYQRQRTLRAATRGGSPFWNEDLMFVAAEPFDDLIHLVVEDTVAPGKASTCILDFRISRSCSALRSSPVSDFDVTSFSSRGAFNVHLGAF